MGPFGCSFRSCAPSGGGCRFWAFARSSLLGEQSFWAIAGAVLTAGIQDEEEFVCALMWMWDHDSDSSAISEGKCAKGFQTFAEKQALIESATD